MKIFTKRFYGLTHSDQVAIVDATIRDLELAMASAVNEKPRKRLKQSRRRIERKAVECGVYSNGPSEIADLSIDCRKDEWVEE